MVKYQAILIGIILLLLLLAVPGMVRADDPTPTYTMTPWPMPTRAFQYLRATPSPFAITPSSSVIDLGSSKAGELADTIINGYRFLNFGATEDHGGVLDLIMFIVMGFLVIQTIMALIEGMSDG